MDMRLSDKRAVVTGASAGIGRAIAKGLAAEGARLCVVARRIDKLEELRDEIVAEGGRAPELVLADFFQDGAAELVASEAAQRLGGVDILVNSAGAGVVSSGLHEAMSEEDEWEATMMLNFTSIRRLTAVALPGMLERGWGRIICISGKSEQQELSPTSSSKAALHAWAHGLSKDVAGRGVNINCISPGRIVSEQILRNYTPEERARQEREEIPAGRFGEAEELAYLAVCLASPRASYITGTVMHVDGGKKLYIY